jgi:Domain of Unknown Function (DUF1080)
MKRWIIALLTAAVAIAGCATRDAGSGWITLIDGDKGLENFNRVGDANWRAEGGTVLADSGKGGFLVTKNSYRDFELHAEFWAEDTTNSGIFFRAMDPNKIGADNSYEANIFDQRPGPEYATASIVNFAKVPVPNIYKAGGKWNTFAITAKGSRLQVSFNGQQSVDIVDGSFPAGPFALQYATGAKGIVGGVIKWRKVQIRPI